MAEQVDFGGVCGLRLRGHSSNVINFFEWKTDEIRIGMNREIHSLLPLWFFPVSLEPFGLNPS